MPEELIENLVERAHCHFSNSRYDLIDYLGIQKLSDSETLHCQESLEISS